MPPPTIVIDYRRLPDRTQRFEQVLVHESQDFTVTYLAEAKLTKPVLARGEVILEPGAPVVWFTYPGEWHDIGRFHRADGRFTGIYANVLTPVVMDGHAWSTTDLFLDVWCGIDREAEVLDEEELEEALRRGWVSEAIASRARSHAGRLLQRAAAGEWPPPEVHEWTLERVRESLGYSSGSST